MEETPREIKVSRSKGPTVVWPDGERSAFALPLLRSMCPCAKCKEERAEKAARKPLLNVLPGNYVGELSIIGVDMVGNYALKIEWSDQHDTGIYTFAYLRELSQQGK